MTRRIINPQPSTFFTALSWKKYVSHCPSDCSEDDHVKTFFNDKSIYGQPGDLLWVREEHYSYGHWIEKEGHYTKTGRQKWMFVPVDNQVIYEQPDEFRKGRHSKDPHTNAWHKRLARFMPKSAARIWLQVESIRVERLQDISGDDALAEGVGEKHCSGAKSMTTAGIDYRHWKANQKSKFQKLWVEINGTDSWAANPWVWVIKYKVLSKTGKPV